MFFVVFKDYSIIVLVLLNLVSVICNGNEVMMERIWRGRDRLYVGFSIFSINMDNSVIVYVRSLLIRVCNCYIKCVLGYFYRLFYF